ncbi:hypothetical protein EYF80_005344 [Liparis tanakae]|uniref:Uncharacterized protein n=1 Tax=Liparis tanakae TaxID=230148 RepID=A0A4Z2J345_9TELE|nr:hypothetical protein EYF80_005344 [Liparis tanakae]
MIMVKKHTDQTWGHGRRVTAYTEVADDPGQKKAQRKLPLYVSQSLYATGDIEHPSPDYFSAGVRVMSGFKGHCSACFAVQGVLTSGRQSCLSFCGDEISRFMVHCCMLSLATPESQIPFAFGIGLTMDEPPGAKGHILGDPGRDGDSVSQPKKLPAVELDKGFLQLAHGTSALKDEKRPSNKGQKCLQQFEHRLQRQVCAVVASLSGSPIIHGQSFLQALVLWLGLGTPAAEGLAGSFSL